MKYLFLLVLVLALIFIFPFVSIWSLNTLFPSLNIDFTLETWGAAAFLNAHLFGNIRTKS